MSRPLFFKELRETWWMGLIAFFVAGGVTLDAMGIGFGNDGRILWAQKRGQSPFLSHFAYSIGTTAICLGVVLGLWQTLSESVAGTWSYLLHRPMTRRRIMATKLLAGLVVLIVSIGLPILVYFLWALSGAHAAPFELWMTESTLRLCGTGLVAYLAGFLTGIRSAGIYLSRWLPLVPLLLIIAAQEESSLYVGWWAQEESWIHVGWCLVLAGIVLFLPSIFFAAEDRDYA